MDRYRAPIATNTPSALKPEGKKLRRKLQKIPNQRNSVQFATGNAKATESRSFLSSFTNKKTDLEKTTSRTTETSELPIDLSDPKWDEYLRTSRYTATNVEFVPQPPSRECLAPPAEVIPEFAHLNIAAEPARKSSESFSTYGTATPSSASSTASASRRYAKTPVTRIGQLEAVASQEPPLTQDGSGIEAIAESYRALLESRNTWSRNSFSGNSFAEERFMTPFQSFDEVPQDLSSRLWDIRPATPIETILDLPLTPRPGMGSPTSSDGTLVGFEEDSIYFKPVAFSPERRTPSPVFEIRDSPVPSPIGRNGPKHFKSTASIMPENPTVQIVFDLLTKELSAAASGNTMRPSTETSSLQIWLMIEAYEKLKENVEGMGLGPEQTQSVQAMFGTWLNALHTIHDDMTGNDGQRSESDYGE
ncbi:hypothetical protein TruAng_007179 [Truncatella angustata]|nr:hypothetical protein TruAng_007179 [Truncatella angustata]